MSHRDWADDEARAYLGPAADRTVYPGHDEVARLARRLRAAYRKGLEDAAKVADEFTDGCNVAAAIRAKAKG